MSSLVDPAERTMTFSRMLPGGLEILSVNLDRWEELQRTSYPYRLWAVTTFEMDDDNGLPSEEESRRLDVAVQSLLSVLPNNGDSLFLGQLTHRGQHVAVIYTSNENLIGGERRGAVAAGTKKWALYLDDDAEYTFLQEKMLPTSTEQRRVNDAAMLATLQNAGDDSSQHRVVFFAAYFNSLDDAQNAAVLLAKNGFRTEPAAETGEAESGYYPYVLSFTKNMIATAESIEKTSSRSEEIAIKCNGAYAGWTCEPVSGDE